MIWRGTDNFTDNIKKILVYVKIIFSKYLLPSINNQRLIFILFCENRIMGWVYLNSINLR
jgi:hypothetical protein